MREEKDSGRQRIGRIFYLGSEGYARKVLLQSIPGRSHGEPYSSAGEDPGSPFKTYEGELLAGYVINFNQNPSDMSIYGNSGRWFQDNTSKFIQKDIPFSWADSSSSTFAFPPSLGHLVSEQPQGSASCMPASRENSYPSTR